MTYLTARQNDIVHELSATNPPETRCGVSVRHAMIQARDSLEAVTCRSCINAATNTPAAPNVWSQVARFIEGSGNRTRPLRALLLEAYGKLDDEDLRAAIRAELGA